MSLVYNTTSFDTPSDVLFADGDGTVSTVALNICSNWVMFLSIYLRNTSY